VLRLRPGDEIVVLDNSGLEWQVSLTEVTRNRVQGQIMAQRLCPGEPGLHLTLYQGTLKGQKFEWVLQKGTELGVSNFAPTICQRSVVRDQKAVAKKEDRWQQIIREAAEQSGRGKLPRLEPALSLADALSQAQANELVLMPWEETTEPTLKQILAGTQVDRIALFIGPEGGFTRDEANQARATGAKLITLGPRILRAETAGIAVCAAILYEMNEWR
jgi:16S rRNA (uracil1498-N3)-methyltransferase